MTIAARATHAASWTVASCSWGSALGSARSETTRASEPATTAAIAAHWVTPVTMMGRAGAPLAGGDVATPARTNVRAAARLLGIIPDIIPGMIPENNPTAGR